MRLKLRLARGLGRDFTKSLQKDDVFPFPFLLTVQLRAQRLKDARLRVLIGLWSGL